MFSGLDVNMMVKTFTDLVLTVITDTIPNKLITCNSNDPHPGLHLNQNSYQEET